jgi:hypothetical protein
MKGKIIVMLLAFRAVFLFIILDAMADAGPAPFDLAGPTLEVKVTREGKTLPVSQVPNLVAGDRLWIKADLPANQSAQYLLVTAFLSGSTNPPPESWFFPCKTWSDQCGRDGFIVTVPKGAEQVLLFLAPATRGDFRTLVGAVRGRPGAFVRTSQDLNQAALDRSRLVRYLSAIRVLNDADPSKVKDAASLLARSLAIKLDEKCLDRIAALQAPCLMQGEESLILNDGHSTSIVQALTSGPGSDLAMEASFTPQLGYGYYSPYVASVLDIARIMDSFRTAQYQYIPALTSPREDKLALTLNMAPSFYNPKSVLVVALPAVEQPQLPPLHAVDPKEFYCANRTALVLPVEGAPLVFSTDYAHDVTLTLAGNDGKTIRLPAHADAAQGGYVVDTSGMESIALGQAAEGKLRGYWGFEPYEGPNFHLINSRTMAWALAPRDEETLIVGRQNTVHLRADSVSCLDRIMLRDSAGKELKAEWKTVKPNEVEVNLPLQESQPGAMTLLIAQYGRSQAQSIPLKAFSDAGHFDGFAIRAGDVQGILKGSRLDEVASLSIGNVVFAPGELSTRHGVDELPMIAQDTQGASTLKADHASAAKITLTDGRVLRVPVSVDPPPPRVLLIARSVQSPPSGGGGIQLANQDELAPEAKLTFSLRAQSPATFTHEETIEVATVDELFSVALRLDNGGLRLEDARVAVATLDPAKAFGPSAFGPLRFRVLANGGVGDWQPLTTLVRLPVLKDLQCPTSPDLACKLSGSDLFLIDSVGNNPQFDRPVKVPAGFPGYALPVPHPVSGRLYLTLRDNPSVINSVVLEIRELPPSPDEVARAVARHDAVQPENEPVANPNGSLPSAAGSTQTPAVLSTPPVPSNPPPTSPPLE